MRWPVSWTTELAPAEGRWLAGLNALITLDLLKGFQQLVAERGIGPGNVHLARLLALCHEQRPSRRTLTPQSSKVMEVENIAGKVAGGGGGRRNRTGRPGRRWLGVQAYQEDCILTRGGLRVKATISGTFFREEDLL